MQKHPRIFKQKIQSGNDDEGSSENHNRQFRRVLQCTKNPFSEVGILMCVRFFDF